MTKNKRKKRLGIVLIAIGFSLLAVSVSIIGSNIHRENESFNSAEKTLTELKKYITANSESENKKTDEEIEIDGSKYIGIISIPKLNVELPVVKNFSYDDLEKSPCRYYGSVKENDLVIAAHNYKNFFSGIDTLNSDDKIIFTQCDGSVHVYGVSYTEVLNGYQSDKMLDKKDDWDLTLFTCDWSGYSRITVRAIEISNSEI